MSQEKMLLLGFGDIAQRLAGQLSDQYAIVGVRRQAKPYPGVAIATADIADVEQMAEVLAQPTNVIVITLTPDEMTDAGYERAYVKPLQNLLTLLPQQNYQPRLILFVSSTSVYGQQQGEWVDEDSPTEPTGFSGKRLLQAESLLLNSDCASCCVRFSGIYGPGRRRLLQQVMDGHGAAAEPVLYSNRIHADDCAGVLAHLINLQKQQPLEPVYLASDCEPSPLHEVKNWLAQQLHLPADHLQPKPLGRTLRSSKRCANQRLLNSGYQFRYPTFKHGYSAVMLEDKAAMNE